MNNSQGSSLNAQAILSVSGRGLPVRGNDIDTDRIMPARFLVSVSFEGLERHVFEDDPGSTRRRASPERASGLSSANRSQRSFKVTPR